MSNLDSVGSRLQIVAEHADFLVVCKPPEMSFHAGPASGVDGCRPDAGVLALLREQVEGPLHAVHRLDRLTSGLLLVARGADAARVFGERFSGGGMHKLYLALSDRAPSQKQGRIRGGMSKGRDGSWRLTRTPSEAAPAAVTQFFSFGLGVLSPDEVAGIRESGEDRFAAGDRRSPLRLFVVRPLTGRTHQIRVALKSLGSPILGDARYSGTPADRGYLHAWALRFEWGGTWHDYRLAPTDGMFFGAAALRDRLAALGDPWALRWPGAAAGAAPAPQT